MLYDIITFGSAAQDVLFKSKKFQEIEENKRFLTGKGLCIPLGSKVPIDNIEFLSGGGGTNAAFTFANQGFKTAFCGTVGNDLAGKTIKDELQKKKISTSFLFFNKICHTNYSVIIPTKDERTILVYRGASENFRKKDIPFGKLQSKWFYLAPLSGKLVKIFEPILKLARKKGFKTVVNPGGSQLSLPKAKLKKLLSFVDVLILNQEEASLIAGISYHKHKEIFRILDKWVGGIVIMTRGCMGSIVSDGKFLYQADILSKKKIVDRTGCGDAFGSGFVVGLIKAENRRNKIKDNIKYAIQFGSANAFACLQKLGAKNGLLNKKDSIFKWGKVKIKKTKIRS